MLCLHLSREIGLIRTKVKIEKFRKKHSKEVKPGQIRWLVGIVTEFTSLKVVESHTKEALIVLNLHFTKQKKASPFGKAFRIALLDLSNGKRPI